MSQLLNYPVRALVFEGGNTIRDLSDTVANSLVFLQNNNIPFNVLISDRGKKIYLFPQVKSSFLCAYLVFSTWTSYVYALLCDIPVVLIPHLPNVWPVVFNSNGRHI